MFKYWMLTGVTFIYTWLIEFNSAGFLDTSKRFAHTDSWKIHLCNWPEVCSLKFQQFKRLDSQDQISSSTWFWELWVPGFFKGYQVICSSSRDLWWVLLGRFYLKMQKLFFNQCLLNIALRIFWSQRTQKTF